MLAASINTETQLARWPLVVSPKIDGIRAVGSRPGLLSRTLKPLPNAQLQDAFQFALWMEPRLRWLDFEVTNSPDPKRAGNTFNAVQSSVMTKTHTQTCWQLWAFDHLEDMDAPYWGPGGRHSKLTEILNSGPLKVFAKRGLNTSLVVRKVPQILVASLDALRLIEEDFLRQGWEGLMVRDPKSRYKCGRSTVRELCLGKVKQFEDSEAKVTGFVEQFTNTNDATVDARGYTKRSSHQANKIPTGRLGALVGEDPKFGRIEIGTGFTEAERQHIWDNQAQYVGQLVKYKYFPIGVQDKPRFPVFLGWRNPIDL